MLVLVVDDEVAIVELLAELLVDEGYEVRMAYDGRNALALLHGGLRPAVIISDIMMPGLDGWALYHAIRENLALRSTGVVLMSAGRPRPTELLDQYAKFNSDPHATFINKPFGVHEILEAIDRVL